MKLQKTKKYGVVRIKPPVLLDTNYIVYRLNYDPNYLHQINNLLYFVDLYIYFNKNIMRRIENNKLHFKILLR